LAGRSDELEGALYLEITPFYLLAPQLQWEKEINDESVGIPRHSINYMVITGRIGWEKGLTQTGGYGPQWNPVRQAASKRKREVIPPLNKIQ